MKKLEGIILLSFISVASTAAALVTPALPNIEKYYSLGAGAINWIVSIFLFAYMLGQIIYGPLANSLGRVKALQIGMTINLLGVVISLLSISLESYSLMLCGRFISALGASAGLVCTIILINEGYSALKSKWLLSYSIVSFTLGINIGVFLGGFLTSYFGWQYCFWLLFFYGIFMLLLTVRLRETLEPENRIKLNLTTVIRGYQVALSNKKLVMFSLIVALATIISYSYAAEGSMIARFQLGLTAYGYGLWNLINAVGMMMGGILSAWLLQRVKGLHVIAMGLFLVFACTLSLSVMMFSEYYFPAWFFFTTLVLFCALGLIYPSASFYASNAIDCKANASSAMNFINMGAGVLVVSLIGYLHVNALFGFIIAVTSFAILACILTGVQYKAQNY